MSNHMGEEVIIEEAIEVEPVFGNGHSLKFFNVLFKVLIFFNIPALLLNLNNLFEVYQEYGSVSKFFSVYGNISSVLFQVVSIVMVALLINYSVKNKAQEFAYLYLFVNPINVLGTILSLILYISQYPEATGELIGQSLIPLLIAILVYIPMFIYLKKRLIKKSK